MNFIKQHAFYIICGLAAAGGVALAVTGLGAMPEVQKELENVKGIYDGLNNVTSGAANEDMIVAKRNRIDEVLSDSEKVVEEASELYDYKPLVPEVFPNGDNVARFSFREKYNEAMKALFDSLNAGEPPSEVEVQVMTEFIDQERFREQEKGLGAPTDTPTATGDPYTEAGVLTEAGVKSRARQRAAIKSALGIYCYATPYSPPKRSTTQKGPVSSLQYHPELVNLNNQEPPFIEDCWMAQVQYWLQRDIVEAINAVNEEAGDQASQNGQPRWVGIMPVKDIISIRTSIGYILDTDEYFVGAEAGGIDEAFPASTANTVFTRSYSGPTYDVMQFTVKLIMDQRDIMKLVDKICENRFHTLLRFSYRAVAPNRYMVGKIYGPEPVVNVVLDFETIMMPGVFRKMIPTIVCEQYGMNCPEPETAPEGE